MPNGSLKQSLAFLPPVLFVLFIIAFSVFFNMSVIDIRFQELDKTLYRIAHQQDLNKSLNMLAKYSIIKRRMERGYEDSADYAVESKVMAVIASDFLKDEPRNLSAWNYLNPIVRIGMNLLRVIMGKSQMAETEKIKDNQELEVAYFYERNRRYDKALSMYVSILKAKKHSSDIEAYIILHKGFCESMNGDMEKARASYEDVIARFADTEAAVTAWTLLDFINKVDDELTEIRKNQAPTIAYGKQLYLLMDYKNAITVFSEIEKSAKDPRVLSEAVFLKGRCHEELGEAALAVDNYRRLLNDYPETKWATEANRRVYILGEFYERDKQITQIAMARLQKYRDANFFDELNTFSGIMGEESKTTDKERVAQRASVRKALTKSDADVLDIIEKLDLSGEKAAEKEAVQAQKQQAEEFQQARKEMQKERLDVNAHPLRKPSFIGREIESKAKPLQGIYNAMLKRGADFSGALRVSFLIETDGKTSHVAIDPESDIQNDEFRDKVLTMVKSWSFPAIEPEYGPQKVTYPVVFKKSE
ncbi:MAG: AgmX/PglI C-terminal domain-containing protein [Fibrobacterota bacterium]